tara:strand:+ start:3035 stop:3370 length:336 start_codon:yes stop_codon:yes gene_type:complete
MMPINPKDMQKAMKRLGIKQQEINASEVIIRCEDKDIIISNPQISKVNMMGNEVFQVSGQPHEQERSSEVEIQEEDIQTVIDQTSCTKEKALEALKDTNGNIAEAILQLQE